MQLDFFGGTRMSLTVKRSKGILILPAVLKSSVILIGREFTAAMKTMFLICTLCAQLLLAIQGAGSPIDNDKILKHIQILASDSLEGRQVGEEGEQKAAAYISGQFKTYGLLPAGDQGDFLQSFEFTKKIEFGLSTRLAIDGKELELGTDYRPLLQSASKPFKFEDVIWVGYGITVPHSSYDDYYDKEVEGKAVLLMRYSPEDEQPDSSEVDSSSIEWQQYSSIADKILNAIEHKVSGVFLITPENYDDTLLRAGATRVHAKEIPIVHLKRSALKRLGIDISNPKVFMAAGEVDLVRVRDTGYNVLGYLPGESDTTIIIGAHYDHLGWGAPGSLYRGKEPKIHHGADDNASGSSGVLELARYYSERVTPPHFSMLFASFSGEEAGLLGSSYFSRNMTIDSSKIRMMINMDMIGRLADQEKGLAIFGTGTCNEFKTYFDSLESDDFTLTIKESGTGPSDHTAFYNRDIPVLFFFTGAHEDYHKPSDVTEKIDVGGIASVLRLITTVTDYFDDNTHPLTFQRTKDEDSDKRRASFSVTLGVMPDYISEVVGLRIDGITPDRAGERAGVMKGDVIIQIGKYTIDDIYAYMNALGKFRLGDTASIVVDRNGDTLSLVVVF